VYSLVSDLISHSYNKNYVGYSPEVGEALKILKQFNYRRIYDNPLIKRETEKIEELFTALFHRFSRDVLEDRHNSPIWTEYLVHMDDGYRQESQPAALVRDYLASMTDANFLRQCQDLFFPQPLPLKFA